MVYVKCRLRKFSVVINKKIISDTFSIVRVLIILIYLRVILPAVLFRTFVQPMIDLDFLGCWKRRQRKRETEKNVQFNGKTASGQQGTILSLSKSTEFSFFLSNPTGSLVIRVSQVKSATRPTLENILPSLTLSSR